MQFYLGTHLPQWLGRLDVPLFVSHRRLMNRRSMPRAIAPWALDSGGFTELAMYGEWRTSPESYVAAVKRYADEVGLMDFAAPQDWMCEPSMLEKTGLTVAQHQQRTVDNYIELKMLAPEQPFIPVLQGWSIDDYVSHVYQYDAAGIDLTQQLTVGLGSVCRRQATGTVDLLVETLSGFGIRLHGFGIKGEGVAVYGHNLASADSMAWSYRARYGKPLPGCTHRRCSNCPRFALRWRERVLAAAAHRQLRFFGAA